ncbi:hypothetical protein [Rhodococcus sp. NPDC060176]|uniref:hypothetical protein n=1 Tax=Rhodococcus sp. NPDC060176 TaxID=3347062 RepID=UPI00364A5E67
MTTSLTLADRVTKLFVAAEASGRTDLSDSAVDAVTASTGLNFTHADMEALRGGAGAEPPREVLDAIATHFEAPLSYLSGTRAEIEKFDVQLEMFFKLAGTDFSLLAMRSRQEQLSPTGAAALTSLIERTHARYGKPAAEVRP